jgi:hypothetical protein
MEWTVSGLESTKDHLNESAYGLYSLMAADGD